MLNVAPFITRYMFRRYLQNYPPFAIEIIEWFYSQRLRDVYRCVTGNHTGNNSAITP